MTGPVWVEGAEPGDVLEVRIVGFEFLHPYGITGFLPDNGTLPTDFPYTRFKRVPVDPTAGTAAFAPGVTLRLAPFFGSIGVAPSALVGRVSSGPPGHHAGNLDNKELVAGSTLGPLLGSSVMSALGIRGLFDYMGAAAALFALFALARALSVRSPAFKRRRPCPRGGSRRAAGR